MAEELAGKPDPAPSWERLARTAKEAAATRFTPQDLAAQVDKKEERLASLRKQQGALEAQVVNIIASAKASIEEIEAIDDEVLRNESLIRFRSTKDTRLKTVQATLAAVNEAIQREQSELSMLQRLLQGRKAEARLYGAADDTPSSYAAYLAREAGRVRASETEAIQRIRDARLGRLAAIALSACEPKRPTLSEGVLTMAREK
jgi:chromosome segregation ATPase